VITLTRYGFRLESTFLVGTHFLPLGRRARMVASLQPVLHDSRVVTAFIRFHMFNYYFSLDEGLQPGSVAVIDESVYEYAGESPVHVCALFTPTFP
jgi:hypothetical protein